MTTASVQGLDIAYELIGHQGQPWVITPGGRFSGSTGSAGSG